MELINDLLDIAKIESDSVELEKAPFELRKIVEDVIAIMSVKASERDIALITEMHPDIDNVFVGDSTRIKQIIMNLMSNAIKFTEHGSVTLRIENEAAADSQTALISIDVIDTGIGIAPEKLTTIFNKFSQADSSITRKYGGTGLGLAITKQLLELMGSSLNVVSEQGVGTAFSLKLPLDYANAPLIKAKQSHGYDAKADLNAKKLQILLVEDYEPNILVAKSMLESLGYSCKIARNGKEALDILERQAFNLVLMDVQMPVLDGYSTVKIIREKEMLNSTPRMKIFGVTAHALAGDKEKCLNAGMDDYLPKPFNASELQKKIRLLYH